MVTAIDQRLPVKSDVPPELDLKEGEEPTEEQKQKVLREAVNHYIRTSLRAPDVRKICEEFIAAIDGVLAPPLPDVPVVSIMPIGVIVPRVGGSGIITVTITAPGESGTWTVEKDDPLADWLTFTPDTAQSYNGNATWTAEENTGLDRAANLNINGTLFAVEQHGVPELPETESSRTEPYVDNREAREFGA